MTSYKLLKAQAVADLTSMSRSDLHRLARDGKFPKPIKIGENRSAWLESDVRSASAFGSIMQEVNMPSDFYPTHLPNGGCNFTIAEILDLISAKFKEHVKFQDESDADALALWAVMTYVMEHLEIAPMVYVTSPETMCGKSTVMKLLKVFCHRAEMVSKITPAAIYRIIERDQPTLIFD